MSRNLQTGPKAAQARADMFSPGGQKPPSQTHLLAWLPIPVFVAVIIILAILNITTRFEAGYLMMALNIAFVTMVSVFVAFLAAKTYLVRGEPAVLFLGCGMWTYGLASGVAGVLDSLGMDAYVVTVHNCGAFLAGLCILVSAISAMVETEEEPAAGPALRLPLLYLIALGAIALITTGAVEGIIPPFFIPGAGATPLRQAVLIAACLQFSISSVLFAAQGRQSDTSFLRWYAMGLALIAIGLLGVIPEIQLGTPLDWAARLAQYLGEVYILYAAFSAFQHYHTWGIPVGRAFQELEWRYRSLVELCPDAILVQSQGKYVYANPAAVRLFGAKSPEDLIGRDVIELMEQAPGDPDGARIQQACEGEATPLRDFTYIRLDGQSIDVQATGARVEFGGKPAVQIVARDISELKSAAKQLMEAKQEAEGRARELEESKRTLDALMENIPEGITIADAPDVHTVMTSKYGDRILAGGMDLTRGLTMEDWLARVRHFLADGTTTARTEDLPLWRAVRQGETVDGQEMVLQKPSGDQIRVLCNAGPIRDGDGNITGGIVAWRDITERKRTEELLRQSERLYRAIGESIDYGVWVCAPDGRNIYASESFLKMVGITQEQCANFGWGEVLHPDDAERTIAAWKECVRTGGVWDIEHRFRGVDGKWHAVLARGVPVRDERGGIACWAGINLDISRLKDAEEALRLAMAELDRRVQERTEELSQTIDTLQIEVAQRTLAEQALRDRSEQLRLLSSELTLAEQRERQRLAQILHDGLQQILVGAKFRLALMRRPGGENLQQITAELEDLVDEAIETSRSLTAELSPPILHEFGLVPALEWLARWMHDKHALTLELKADAQAEPAAEDVKVLLFQATRELLFNVVKHARVTTVRVQLTREDNRIQVLVADDGAGFDPTQVRAVGGSAGGFGLFSIRERIHLLGGEMVIDSAPGKGTRITVAAPSPAAREGDKAAEAGRDLLISVSTAPLHAASAVEMENKIQIVLVDDHIVMRQGLSRLLKEAPDMEIVGEASDGEAAVNLVRRTLPHVVLMDISMPGMNGIQATQIIHAEHPHIRVIGLSMFEEGEQALAMRAAGAVGYLTKSGPADAIISTIRACAAPSGEKAAKQALTSQSGSSS